MKKYLLFIMITTLNSSCVTKNGAPEIIECEMLIISVRSCENPEYVRMMIGLGSDYREYNESSARNALSELSSVERVHFDYGDKCIPKWFNKELLKKELPYSIISLDPARGGLPLGEFSDDPRMIIPYTGE
jgi:hypothetical protein